jgi:hypothetical protein
MLRTLARRFASEIALHRHNKANRRGVVSPEAQHYHVLNDILPAPIHEGLLASIQAGRASWVRSETSWRRGAAMGGHELRASASARWLLLVGCTCPSTVSRQRVRCQALASCGTSGYWRG